MCTLDVRARKLGENVNKTIHALQNNSASEIYLVIWTVVSYFDNAICRNTYYLAGCTYWVILLMSIKNQN